MGVGNFLAQKWAGLKAWARSVPPDVWIGLGIGFVTLLVIWLTYKKSGGSTGVSTTSPTIGDTSSGPISSIPGIPGDASNPPLTFSPPSQIFNPTFPTLTFRPPSGIFNPGPGVATSGGGTGFLHANPIINTPDESVIAKLINPIVQAPVISQAPIGISGALWGDTNTEINAPKLFSPAPAPVVVSQSSAPGALPGDTMAENTPAPAPAPIPVTFHAPILQSVAYAPVKAAKNDIGIY